MYTILVADSEKLAREDVIYKVGASGIPFEWIMEASNADEAMEIIKANHPDILITDVLLTGSNALGIKDGIELIEEAKKINSRMASVVVCAFPDFYYAQRAMRLGVMHYLLKPAKFNEIKTILAELTSHIDAKKREFLISTDNYALRKRLEDYKLKDKINSYVNGSLEDQEINSESLFNLFPDDSKWFQFWSIRAEDVNSIFSDTSESIDRMIYAIKNIIIEVGSGYVISADLVDKSNILVALAASNEQDEIMASKSLSATAATTLSLIEKSLGIKVDIGLSKLRKRLLSSNLIEAQKAMDVRFCRIPGEKKSVYCFEELEMDGDDKFKDADMLLFKKFVDASDSKSALPIARKIILEYSKAPYLNIRDTYAEMINMVSKVSYKKGVSILSFLGYENISGNIINRFETAEEVADSISSIVEMTLGSWVRYMENTTDVLEKVKKYIDENFSDSELCTKKLAQHFCISLGYLSATYRKMYNITISKYIISKRMEYAAKLLKDTNVAIGDISESCGFNNLSYFMRVFKSYYMVTPTQFREGI